MSNPVALSVIATVRGRLTPLVTMLNSLEATVSDPTRVEVVLRCDHDDHTLVDYLCARWAGQPSAQLRRMVVGPRISGYSTLATLVNEAARLSTGALVLVVNDDVLFETPNWDQALEIAAAQYPDGIFDLGVDTGLNDDNFVFPCVSRRMVEILGCLFDERLVYTDIWLRDVAAKFNRAVRVHGVMVRHLWTGITQDQYAAIRLVQDPSYQALYELCVRQAQAKIMDSRAVCVVPGGGA